ncbi:MAG: DUF4442 domain-containing protein [Hahellaceae bacterium]|nr:DUF4442 domain-containing protein [Hahellaceae bacterium]
MTAQGEAESLESRLWRWGGNLFPAYRLTGARVIFVAAHFREVEIEIPSNWRTRNYMGITWGGGLYAALDPIYGVMLYKLLGRRYRVVDKIARMHFKRPVKTTLSARFHISEDEVGDILRQLKEGGRLERTYWVHLEDAAGVVHASCEKVVSILPRSG